MSLTDTYNDIKSGAFGKKVMTKAQAYKQGVIYGAIAGGIVWFVIRKHFWICIAAGGLGGGYLAHELKEHEETLPVFNNYGIDNENSDN